MIKSTGEGLDKTYAVVIDGDYTIESSNELGELNNHGGVIVATGNITINGDLNWRGVIICGGKITINGKSVLTSDPVKVSTAMGLETTSGNYVYNLFVGGESYSVNKDASAVEEATDIRDCLKLENYRSK